MLHVTPNFNLGLPIETFHRFLYRTKLALEHPESVRRQNIYLTCLIRPFQLPKRIPKINTRTNRKMNIGMLSSHWRLERFIT